MILARIYCIVFLLAFWPFSALLPAEQGRKEASSHRASDELSDFVIGSTCKSLAKAFLAVADLDKAKANAAARLNKMSEAKFRRRYSEVYGLFKDSPEIRRRYGFTENMAKADLIKRANSLDKRQISEMIDGVPDKIIGTQFAKYMQARGQDIQKISLVQQINKILRKMTSS